MSLTYYGPPFRPSSVNITGGTINGTAIGGTTPAAGAFTTLSATGQITNATTSSARFQNGNIALLIGADGSASTLTDATNKAARMAAPHYLNAEEPVALFLVTAQSTANIIQVGGGSALMNAVTAIDFLTAVDNVTPTGTRRGGFNAAGRFDLAANISSTSTTTGTLVVTGGVGVSENIRAGGLLNVAGDMQLDKTITAAATTGAQTINKNAGSVNFAAAATSLVVTNSRVTANSIIIATVATNDTTLKSVAAVAAAGSFTLHANAAATAETRVNFIVIN